MKARAGGGADGLVVSVNVANMQNLNFILFVERASELSLFSLYASCVSTRPSSRSDYGPSFFVCVCAVCVGRVVVLLVVVVVCVASVFRIRCDDGRRRMPHSHRILFSVFFSSSSSYYVYMCMYYMLDIQ